MSRSLNERIGKLISAIGSGQPPSIANIKGMLVKFAAEAKLMEDGQSAVEAEQKIAVMEATIKELESKLQRANTQGEQLKGALDATKHEIRRAKQKEEESEPLSTIESRVLHFIDGAGHVYGFEVANHLGMPRRGVEELLIGLVSADFATSKEDYDEIAPQYFLSKKGKAWLAREREKIGTIAF